LIEIKTLASFPKGGGSVPRFHFDVYDGTQHIDSEGEELPDLSAVRTYAIRYFRDMLHDDLEAFWNGEEWRMDVADETGLRLFSLHFVGINAPALDRPDVTISVLPPS
jgi:hypothetical protein